MIFVVVVLAKKKFSMELLGLWGALGSLLNEPDGQCSFSVLECRLKIYKMKRKVILCKNCIAWRSSVSDLDQICMAGSPEFQGLEVIQNRTR